jgi:hypothetical protein
MRRTCTAVSAVTAESISASECPRTAEPYPAPTNDVSDATSDASFPVSSFTSDLAAGPVLFRKDGGGRLVGDGLHRWGVFGQDELVGDAAVERSLPLVEIRLPVGV